MCDYLEKCRYNDTLLPGMGLPEKNFISLDIREFGSEKVG